MKRWILLLLFLFISGIGACLVKYLWDRNSYVMLEQDYKEGTQSLRNPERGWYLMNACRVSDDYTQADAFQKTLKQQYKEGDTLAQVLFNLSDYRDRDISENGLVYVGRMLSHISEAGMKAIVRFVYDWDGLGEKLEPDRLETVLRHMEQLGPVLNENRGSIYLLQGIFVGSYGEMNGSKFLSSENVDTLLKQLLSVTDNSLLLSVRTPAYWRGFARSIEPVEHFTQLPYARIGLYNDGLCSSDTDIGTYSEELRGVNTAMQKWGREAEMRFQSRLCHFVPNGGETAMVSEFNELDNVIEEFPRLHISYLHRGYSEEVINRWRTAVYGRREEDPYTGIDGYKYIGDHLGYRFVLREVRVPRKAYPFEAVKIHMKLENTGFAGLYQEKQVELIAVGAKEDERVTASLELDARTWRAGEVSSFSVVLPFGRAPEDTYELYLRISDRSGSSIRMANNGIYNESLQANKLGQITIQRFSLLSLWDLE